MVKRVLGLAAAALLSATAGAANLNVEPGLWEATWTISNPLNGQQVTDRRTECIRERAFNPRSLLRQAQGCRVVSEDQQGNRVRFVLACAIEGGATTGATTTVTGDFQHHGTSGTGTLRTQMQMGGMAMNLDTEVATRRLGPCPAGTGG